jgi:hypothetical protein
MIYCVDGCNGKKRQERGLLAILNFKRDVVIGQNVTLIM